VTLVAGTVFGPYRVIAPIGAGGMGEVYRARDERLGRDVALKVLPVAFHADPERLRRFADEARAAGAVSHPGILAVHDIGEHAGAPYMVSELLEGQTLRERLLAGRLPVRKALDLAAQIAQALAAAHDKGIVHRDLKPENLFVLGDGRVKILDFGLAKALAPEGQEGMAATLDAGNATASGAILGTSGYMAPEQVRGDAVDRRSDLFALGAVLYEMLAGQPAFPGATHVERGYAVLKDDPPPLPAAEGLSPAVEAILRRCLEKRPADRFQSSRDLAFSLQALTSSGTGSGSSTAPPLSVTTAPAPPAGRGARLVWLGVAAVAALGLAGYGLTRHRPSAHAVVAPAPVPSEAPVQVQRLVFRHGNIHNARFLPDPHAVLVSAVFDGEPERTYQVVAGRAEMRALSGDDAHLADVSDNGQVALASAHSEDDYARLAVVDIAGGAPREVLTDVGDAAYLPKSDTLAIIRRRTGGRGEQIELPPGHILYQTDAGLDSLRVSPDGRRVAFIEHPMLPDDRGAVGVVDIATGAHRTLGPIWYTAGGLAFAPNGREVWVTVAQRTADRQIHAFDLESGSERMVAAFPGEAILLDLAADGRALVSICDTHNRILARPPGSERVRDLAWFDRDELAGLTPDGRFILFWDGGEVGGVNTRATCAARRAIPRCTWRAARRSGYRRTEPGPWSRPHRRGTA
jgi:hypothetical protein